MTYATYVFIGEVIAIGVAASLLMLYGVAWILKRHIKRVPSTLPRYFVPRFIAVYTPAELARLCHISVSTARRWARQGKVVVVRAPSDWQLDKADCDRLAAERGQE